VVNVARISYGYMFLYGEQVPVDRNIAQEIGITGVSTSRVNWGTPTVGCQGYSGIGSNNLTQGNTLNNYQFTDDITWIRGGHAIKAGYDLRQSCLFLDSDNGPRGSFTFNASYTASLDPTSGNPVAGNGNGLPIFFWDTLRT
jgi:hypothetical protein